MMERMNRKPAKRIISSVLAVAIFCVFLLGETSWSRQDAERKAAAASVSDIDIKQLRAPEELVLAKTDTDAGKDAESLQEGYEELAKAYEAGKDFEGAVENFAVLVSRLKDRTMAELAETDNGTKEFQDYRDCVLADYEELEDEIGSFDGGNADQTLSKIKEKVAAEQPYVGLGDELPFENVADDDISMEEYTETEAASYEPGTTKYCESDLGQTNDTAINDNVRAEFADLKTPLDIYQYVKNNYMPEFYYGSRKGAVGAYEQKAGNDYDLASLLIGVFRDRNIPARYVRGEIEITAEQAMEWTATDDIHVALRVLSVNGIPATGLTTKDGIAAVRIEHVWIEAYVPYTDYRGAGNHVGESLWIPLDPSFKEVEYTDGVDLSSISDYLMDEENFLTADTEIKGVNIGSLSTEVEGENSAFVKYMLENGYGEATLTEAFGGRSIVSEELGYLPLTLPYRVDHTLGTFDDIPEELTACISFSMGGNSPFALAPGGNDSIRKKLYAPDLYGKRIILSYVPATDADKEVLEQYGGLFQTPAYLLKLKPQLLIDGEVVAEGSVCNAGYRQKYTINIQSAAPAQEDQSVENSIVAGGMYCIALDYGTISADNLKNSADSMEARKASISEENIYTDEGMGRMLDSVAKAYFAQLDVYNSIVAGQNNVTVTRDLSVGIVGFGINVVYTFTRPTELNEGGIFLDIGHDAHSVVSNDNQKEKEQAYMLQSGIYASAMEHGVLEQITGVESVSTIKVLEYAQANHIPLHTISKENLSDEIELLAVSNQVKQEIRASVNAGRIVLIPEKEITLNQWTGTGYMVLDPDTFACAYMISGGLAGGSMTVSEMLGEYVNYVISGAVFMVLWELFKIVILACSPCGWVAAIGLIFKFVELVMLLEIVFEMVNLLIQYFQTGDISCLQELGVQLASLATLGIASKLFGNKLADLKGKIEEALGKAGLKGACFVAGTLVLTLTGLAPIETVAAGDLVQSFDPKTQEVSLKEVEEAFVRESTELVYVKVRNETITTTPNHPFYVAQKGFVNAEHLRAGDILCTVNGESVVVEQIQHEILESPVQVYNFRVADNHTYFVGSNCIGVHNANCSTPESKKNIDDYIKGKKSFDEVLDDYSKLYADNVNSNKKWSWKKDFPDRGTPYKTGERAKIKENAIKKGYLPDVKVEKVDGLRYGDAKFKEAGQVLKTETLPEELWKASDAAQFDYLNEKIGGKIEGYTWHHTLEPGKMELVPTGIHNMVTHNGGRSPGQWADAPR